MKKVAAKKSKKTLEKRIAVLKERGIDLWSGNGGNTIADMVDVIGDLTVDEFQRMGHIELAKGAVSEIRSMARKGAENLKNETRRECDKIVDYLTTAVAPNDWHTLMEISRQAEVQYSWTVRAKDQLLRDGVLEEKRTDDPQTKVYRLRQSN